MSTSSRFVAQVGEPPEVAEADTVADTGEDELQLVGPVVTARSVVSAGLTESAGVGGARGEVLIVDQPGTRGAELSDREGGGEYNLSCAPLPRQLKNKQSREIN